MTDRHAGYVVALETDLRDDEAQATIAALRMVRGVFAVEPIIASPTTQMIEGMRVDDQWRTALRGLVRSGPPRAGD